MKTIFKYPIPVTDEFPFELPKGAKIIAFQTQHEQPCIWVIIDPNSNEKETRYFYMYGTGHPIENVEALTYIGTTQTAGGVLVWHLFERR